MQSEIIQQTQRASGNYRFKLKYTLDDGREFISSYIHADTLLDANQLLIDRLPELLKRISKQDADEARGLGLKTAHKTATQAEVYYAYLFEGYNSESTLDSYLLMKPVAQEILNLGLSVEQMATLFSETLDVANNVFNRWAYLSANEAAILAYKAIKDGM